MFTRICVIKTSSGGFGTQQSGEMGAWVWVELHHESLIQLCFSYFWIKHEFPSLPVVSLQQQWLKEKTQQTVNKDPRCSIGWCRAVVQLVFTHNALRFAVLHLVDLREKQGVNFADLTETRHDKEGKRRFSARSFIVCFTSTHLPGQTTLMLTQNILE